MGIAVLLLVAYLLLVLAAVWMIAKKLGGQGWEMYIPVYDIYFFFKQVKGNGWKFLLLLIPIFNIYYIIKTDIDFAHKLGYSTVFGWGIALCPEIFVLIVGFDKKPEVQADDLVSGIVACVSKKLDGMIGNKDKKTEGTTSKESAEKADPQSAANIVCSNCGTVADDDDMFCIKCGTKLN